MFALIAVILVTVFQSTSYYQIYNVTSIWIQQHVALDLGGFRIPIPWYLSVDAFASIVGVPLVLGIWRWQASRQREPNDLAKIGSGAWISAASNLILVVAILVSGDRRVHPVVPFLYSAGLGIGIPLLLAHAPRAGVARGAGQVEFDLDGARFHEPVCFGNNMIGWIGGFYER